MALPRTTGHRHRARFRRAPTITVDEHPPHREDARRGGRVVQVKVRKDDHSWCSQQPATCSESPQGRSQLVLAATSEVQ